MKKLNRLDAKDFPPVSAAQRQADQQLHTDGPTDPDLKRQGRRIKSEIASRQRAFADVTMALKEAREAAEMSLQDVSDASGITKANLSLLENGKGNPTIDTLERIAKAIGAEILVTVQRG